VTFLLRNGATVTTSAESGLLQPFISSDTGVDEWTLHGSDPTLRRIDRALFHRIAHLVQPIPAISSAAALNNGRIGLASVHCDLAPGVRQRAHRQANLKRNCGMLPAGREGALWICAAILAAWNLVRIC
jgi:hypothetical protein